MQIIHLETVNQGAVGQGSAGAGNLRAVPPEKRALSLSHFLGKGADNFAPRKRRTEESAAERIDKAKFYVRYHFFGDVFIGQSGNVLCQDSSRRVFGSRVLQLCLRHKILLEFAIRQKSAPRHDSAETQHSPLTKLRTNGNCIETTDGFPFMVRPSKHERCFSAERDINLLAESFPFV